ncbi:Hemolysin, contains CBS domains [Raineyella antarctica]|uniref:Hemolysin, contains CBS domains n=1 Tax=Raineyella antarctica TaxID=1577474 RepID=A0A1G6GH19_9ACTN|nr:hemolysin family protein [Raineyella antarctica]SDB81240.1 Hemolysin, contains CBS domains [Raineyella antarctica]
MSTGIALLVLVLLLAGNAFFVAAEFAMVSARRDQIEPRAAAGSASARFALKGIEDVSTSLAATQLGITACSLVIGAVGEPALAGLLEVPFQAFGLPEALVHPVALVIALLFVTLLHMVLGEMVPKNMAIARPAAAALLLGPVLHVFVVVLRPFIWLMNHSANFVVRHVFRAEPRDEVSSAFTSGEVAGFVAESGREGLLDDDQVELLTGALGFEHLTTADVAIPADQLETVSAGATVAEVEQLCAETGFSRFPGRAADGTLVGYLHVKDLLAIPPERRREPVPRELLYDLITVPADAKLQQVMRTMQQHNVHLALVEGTGARAGQAAVVAFEDVLEELVGEVRDATSS